MVPINSIYIVSPKNYPHSETFREVAEGLQEGFKELGHDVLIHTTPPPNGRAIVLGANINPSLVPDNAIVYNLEQAGTAWFSDSYIDCLRSREVWDYDRRNISALESHYGVRAMPCSVGYASTLSRITSTVEDIDVLFYGSIFGRRIPILDAIEATGITVVKLFGVYGKERDDYIARAKIVLNLHAYDEAPLEIVRLSYLLANRKFVVSELPNHIDDLLPGISFWEAEKIPWACQMFLEHGMHLTRQAIAKRGFEHFSSTRQSEYLKPLLYGPVGPVGPVAPVEPVGPVAPPPPKPSCVRVQ